MSDHGNRLNRRQTVALAALLSSPTAAKAAERAGVAERTLRLWMSQPAFRQAFREALGELIGQTVNLLASAAAEAVEALRRNLTTERPGDQNRAAGEILSQLVRLRLRGDHEERLKAVEERLAAREGPS